MKKDNHFFKKKEKLKDFKKQALSKGKTFIGKQSLNFKINIIQTKIKNTYEYSFFIENNKVVYKTTKQLFFPPIADYQDLENHAIEEIREVVKTLIRKNKKQYNLYKLKKIEDECFNKTNIYNKKELVTRNRNKQQKIKRDLIHLYNNDLDSVNSSVFYNLSSDYKINGEKFDYIW